jgi:hypothetical protein
VTLDCDFITTQWYDIGEHYGCITRITDIFNNPEPNTVTGVSGNHEYRKSNNDVRSISIRNQHLVTKLPQGIENFFENLLGLEVWSCQLSTISFEDLRPFPNLIILGLEINQLTSLDGNLFRNTPNLRWLSFQDNKIRNVGVGLLNNLNQLTTVNFLQNYCIHRYANTPEYIENMKRDLPIQCPPAVTVPTTPALTTTPAPTTTTPVTLPPPVSGQCPAECSETIANQGRRIGELENVVSVYESRLAELEKQMREINSNPRL